MNISSDLTIFVCIYYGVEMTMMLDIKLAMMIWWPLTSHIISPQCPYHTIMSSWLTWLHRFPKLN